MSTYDYIVIGAGSSGCVVASRLTEDPKISVLLLEAGGGDDVPEIADPRAFVRLFKSPQDWAYVTEAEPELNGRSIDWPRGKVLGGTSAMNAMIYTRGNRADYDGWASQGNEGWGYKDVLPYFRRSERNSRGASAWHGAHGPLDVTDPEAPHPYSRAFVDAAAELGHARNEDFNGARPDGAGLVQRTIRDGTRCSAARAFLRPALERPNLEVATRSLVTRVNFDGKRAVGAQYLRDGVPQEVTVGREVVLCGGTVNSPQLLLVSGLGPADHLRSLDLSVVADLPGVGRNLQDHPMARVRCWTAAHHPVDPSSNQVEAALFCSPGKGGKLDAPQMYLHFLPVAMVETHEGRERSALAIAAILLRPKSRGFVQLRSPDATDAPVIQPRYFSEREDLELMIAGLRTARALVRTRAFASVVAEETLPGPSVSSDEALEAYVRDTADTLFHPVGTCKMGTDAQSVVDANLRVRGVDGLRVMDASVMPTEPSAPTNAACIMIGERGAEMLKASRSR